MTKIKINDLKFTGASLLEDSETYLSELTEEDINMIQGGLIYHSTPALFVYGRNKGWW